MTSSEDADWLRVLDFSESALPGAVSLEAPRYWADQLDADALCLGAIFGETQVPWTQLEPSPGLRAAARCECVASFEALFEARGEASFREVVCPLRGLQRFVTLQGMLDGLSSVRRALKTGGRFCFDIALPNLEDLAVPLCLFEPFDWRWPDGSLGQARCEGRFDKRRQLWNERYRISSPEGVRVIERSERVFFVAELRGLLERAGFLVTSMFGDFEGGHLTQESRILCVDCERL